MLSKKRQSRRRKKLHNDILSSIRFEISCENCNSEFRYKNTNCRDESVFEIKIIPFEQNIKRLEKRKLNQNFNLDDLFYTMGKSNKKIIKRKGRKKWTEKHQRLLKGSLLLFDEDLDKIHKIIPEFNKRFLKKKINHLYWKKYLLKKDKSQPLELQKKILNIFDEEKILSNKNEIDYSKKNIFEKNNSIFNNNTLNTPIFSTFENSPNNFNFEQIPFSINDENLLKNFYEKNDFVQNSMKTPIKIKKNLFDDSPNFHNLKTRPIFNYFGIESTINSVNNSKYNSPFILKKKINKFLSIEDENKFPHIEDENKFFKTENFSGLIKMDEFLF